MSFLVTGATGLLGSEILHEQSSSIGISSKDFNLTGPGKLRLHPNGKFNTVIHCAAKVGGVKANTDYVADFFDDNIRMNMNVLEACKNDNLKLVSVLSTCIYPDAPYVKYPLTEEQLHMGPPHPSNFGYAYAKRMLEVQSRTYRQQFGTNFITVIPNNLYGLNDNYDLENGHVVPSLIRRFYEAHLRDDKEVVVWGSGNPMREFTFARDAAKIILWLSKNYDGEMPVNIGNTDVISIRNLAKMIAEEVGFEGRIVFDTTKPEGQFEKPSSNVYLRTLGWEGEYTSLHDGLKETINFFKSNYSSLRGVKIAL